MKINRKLLPIKAHYFFFMCAMGPILPQLQVYGKELGVSSVVMGSVTGLLPFAFLIAKPLFGILVDVYRDWRKTIFMMLIVIMTVSFTLMGFIPTKRTLEAEFALPDGTILDTCKVIDFAKEAECNNITTRVICKSTCLRKPMPFLLNSVNSSTNFNQSYRLCSTSNYTVPLNGTAIEVYDIETAFLNGTSIDQTELLNGTLDIKTENANRTSRVQAVHPDAIPGDSCDIYCEEDIETNNGCLYKSFTFWSFVVLMSIGTIGFNVVNSISDAICFDVIGDEYDYGKQRVWGTIGFGVTALMAGYAVDLFSGSTISYIPAMIIMLIASLLDLATCFKLELPIIEPPKNILQDIKDLLKDRYVVTFLTYAVLAGVLDSFQIYFMFWYLEDLAIKIGTGNIKLIEGLIVGAETLGGEVIFFSIAGKILERFGHVHCFSMCFINYALRLGLISIAPSPWWFLPIEFVFQGPTYALTYTTIVAYANDLAPPGASATMQGIAAGMDDGVGYAIGSFCGGLLYQYIGGKNAFQCFSVLAVVCSISHLVIHKTLLREVEEPVTINGDYKSPEEAVKVVEVAS